MSLRTRLTLVVSVVAAAVLGLSMTVAFAQIERRIIDDATAVELDRFDDSVFTFDSSDADGGFGFGTGDASFELGSEDDFEMFEEFIEGPGAIRNFGSGGEVFVRRFIEGEEFMEMNDFIEAEFAVGLGLEELGELAGLVEELETRDLLEIPWEWYDLPTPGEDGGGLVALRDLSLVSIGADGTLRMVEPSAEMTTLIDAGFVRLPSQVVDRTTPNEEAEETEDDDRESLFIDALFSSSYQLLDFGEDEAPPGVLFIDDELYGDDGLYGGAGASQLARIGEVAVEAPAIATAGDALEFLEKALWGAALIVLLALAGITWLMTGRALAPVRAMTSRVGEISGGNLHERVPEPGSGDEIDDLAKTMNGMLGRVERSDGERRRFVSDASHELRSPVASIRAELEVAGRYPDQADWPSVAHNVEVENTRLETIVSDLLALARFDEAESAEAVTAVDLDDIVIDEAHRARRLRVDVSAVSAGRVDGRAGELTTVVRHLLDNAARHAQGRVEVSLTTTDAVVVLTVDDDGSGIPAADRDRVFDRFTRLQDSRDRDSGGAGLGLAVVHAAVTRHNGTVTATDSHLGGARFTIILPTNDQSR